MRTLYNDDCANVISTLDQVDALVTDPPYGINIYGELWDKQMPSAKLWSLCYDKLKPGAFGLVFSSIKLMHHMMINLEDSGFIIKDVIMWWQLNGMPKARNIGVVIDKELGVESEVVGYYNYKQGYGDDESYTHEEKKPKKKPASDLGIKYNGFGLGLKPSYEPIILIQKPLEKGLTVAQNTIKYGTGALNLEDTRIPFADGETKVGHNPHPNGRVMSNILLTEPNGDDYDKFFVVPKVRQHKDDFNNHPTIKPIHLMDQLIKLVTSSGQTILDPFMGSGSTGVSALALDRNFIGIEIDKEYFNIANKRITNANAL